MKKKVHEEMLEYRVKISYSAKPFIWKCVQYTSPITWWKGTFSSTELVKSICWNF